MKTLQEEIPEWIIKYDKSNYQSSAGRAVKELLSLVSSANSENKRLEELYNHATTDIKILQETEKELQEEVERLKKLKDAFGFVILQFWKEGPWMCAQIDEDKYAEFQSLLNPSE